MSLIGSQKFVVSFKRSNRHPEFTITDGSKKFEKDYFVQAIFAPSQRPSVLNSSKIWPRKAPDFKRKILWLQAQDVNKALERNLHPKIELQEDIVGWISRFASIMDLATIMATKVTRLYHTAPRPIRGATPGRFSSVLPRNPMVSEVWCTHKFKQVPKTEAS